MNILAEPFFPCRFAFRSSAILQLARQMLLFVLKKACNLGKVHMVLNMGHCWLLSFRFIDYHYLSYKGTSSNQLHSTSTRPSSICARSLNTLLVTSISVG